MPHCVIGNSRITGRKIVRVTYGGAHCYASYDNFTGPGFLKRPAVATDSPLRQISPTLSMDREPPDQEVYQFSFDRLAELGGRLTEAECRLIRGIFGPHLPGIGTLTAALEDKREETCTNGQPMRLGPVRSLVVFARSKAQGG